MAFNMRHLSLRERLLVQTVIDLETGCWEWQGWKHRQGYGRVRKQYKRLLAHRASYEEFVGPIPDGLCLDHLCCNTSCINPAHLEPVTLKENIQRGQLGETTRKRQLAKKHCPKGHPYSGDNLYIAPDGSRHCRICRREQFLAFHERQAAREAG